MDKMYIKDSCGRILGWIKSDPSGDKIAFDNCGRITGKYRANVNITQDASGRIIAKGDWLSSTIRK